MGGGTLTPRTFGPTSLVSHTVPFAAFVGHTSADTYVSTSARHCAIANCVLDAPVLLPAGVLVTSLEVDACDTNPTEDFGVNFLRAFGSGNVSGTGFVSSSGNPGCVVFTADVTPPHTIDNHENTYYLRFFSPVADSSLRLRAVRILYQLQVSEPSAIASFGDVPTNH